MDFFTKVDIPAKTWQLDYRSNLFFMGSCFADNISAQFSQRKFNVLANPFGTVYNPLSLATQVKTIAEGKVFGEKDVFDGNGQWYSWQAHGSLSGGTQEECIDKLNKATQEARNFLQKADIVFVTLGTAFVYFLKEDRASQVVANCHRQDPALFERRMISVDEAVAALKSIVASLHQIRSGIRIVFTVSPLRHLSDGAHNNTLSKATLQLAINKEIATSPLAPRNDITEYFPSYEIVMDELRDYRFYANDMIHLSKTAEEYIFERMVDTYCDGETRANMARVEKFMKMASHRIVDETSPATVAFRQKLLAEAAALEKEIPGLSLDLAK